MAAAVGLGNVLTPSELDGVDQTVRSKVEEHLTGQLQTIEELKIQNEKLQTKLDQQTFDLETQLNELRQEALNERAKVETLLAEKTKLEEELRSAKDCLSTFEQKYSEHEALLSELQRQKDKLVADNTELTNLLSRRNDDVDRLTSERKALTEQLIHSNREKTELAIKMEEIDSKEIALQYKEKRLEQEKELLVKQQQQLLHELDSRNQELITIRRDQASKSMDIQAELADKIEELRIAQETIATLKTANEKNATQIVDLTERVKELRENETKLQDIYRQELRSQSKMTELYKASSEEAQSKVEELLKTTESLQKLLWDASTRYGELETKSNEEIAALNQKLERSGEAIETLRKELDTANNLLETTRTSAVNTSAIESMSPAAAAASRLLKSGMTLTQIYSQYVSISEQLLLKDEENKRLNNYIDQILQEIEERAPAIARQREDYERSLEVIASLRQQLENAMEEAASEKVKVMDIERQFGQTERANKRLQQQVSDLSKQVRVLLREVEELRGNYSPIDTGEAEDMDASLNSSQQVITQKLVTFRTVEELQLQNQQLLAALRELSDKEEEEENGAVQTRTAEVQEALEKALGEIEKLREARRRQEEMVESIVRQRDMYKMLLQEVGHVTADDSASPSKFQRTAPITSTPAAGFTGGQPSGDSSALQKSLDELQRKLSEAVESKKVLEKQLKEEAAKLKEQLDAEKSHNTRLGTQLEYSEERIKAAMNNMESYKKQLDALEEKSRLYSSIVTKHERSLEILKEEAMTAQQKLARAEVTVSMLQQEKTLLKDTEQRLTMERDALLTERRNQNSILSNLEEIKLNLERGESEGRMRMENTIQSLENERTLLRKKLDAEAERYRETVHTWEKLLQQEKEAVQAALERAAQAEALVNELQQSGTPAEGRGRATLVRKIQSPRGATPSGPSVDVGELRTQLSEARTEVEALREQMRMARQHVEQYRSISDTMEKELKESNETSKLFKEETQKRIEQLSAERVSLASQLESTQQALEQAKQACAHFEEELSSRVSPLQARVEELQTQVQQAQQQLEQAKSSEEQARATCAEQIRVAQEAQEKYERELMQHATDIETLNTVRQQLDQIRTALGEAQQKIAKLEGELDEGKTSWETQKQILTKEAAENAQHCTDLEKQADVLQQQLLTMSSQLASITHAQDPNRSVNTSFGEDEAKSSEQLMEIIRFLRREKEIAASRAETAVAEASRIRTLYEQSQRQIKDLEATLQREQERSATSVMTTSKHVDLMRKLETLNALADSNRLLREERDAFKLRIEDLQTKLAALEAELGPLKQSRDEVSGRNEELVAENQTLRKQLTTWRSRANALQERAGKVSAEELRKLQQEKDALQKQLEQSKEANAKLQSDLTALGNQLTAAQQKLHEETRKLKEEIQKSQAEAVALKEAESKREEEMTKQADQLNQLRRIARKYKTQFEETKAELDKCKADMEKTATEAAAAGGAAALTGGEESTPPTPAVDPAKLKELEEEIAALKEKAEQQNTENQNLNDANEKLKAMLKKARQNISGMKESHTKEMDETKLKMDNLEQSAEEANVRAAALKSQLEGRIARLERENNELCQEKDRLERELETLTQRTGVLQHQVEAYQKQLSLAQQQTQQQQAKSTAEKTPAENPPTANIRPIASTSGSTAARHVAATQPVVATVPSSNQRTTPTASIRPMAMQTRTAAVLPMASVTITPAVAMAAVQALREEEPSTSAAVTREEPEEPTPSTSTSEDSSASSAEPSFGKRKRTAEEEIGSATVEPDDRTKRAHVEEITVSDDDTVEIHLHEAEIGEAAGRDEGDVEEEERQMASEDEAAEEPAAEEEADEAMEEEQEDVLDTADEPTVPEQADDSIQIIQEESRDSRSGEADVEEVMAEPQEQEVRPGEVEASAEPDQETFEETAAPVAARSAQAAVAPRPEAPVRQERLPSIGRQALPYEDTGDDSIVPSTPILLRPRTNDGFAEAVSSPQVPSQFVFGAGDASVPVTSTQQPTLSQLGTQGMEDTRVDLSQLEEGTGRSVPSTPLQVSPPADAVPPTLPAAEPVVPVITVSMDEEERQREMESEATLEIDLLGEEEGDSALDPQAAPIGSQPSGAVEATSPEASAGVAASRRPARTSGSPRVPRTRRGSFQGRGISARGEVGGARPSAPRPVPIIWGAETEPTGPPPGRGSGRGLRRPGTLQPGDLQGPAPTDMVWQPQRARRSRGRRGQ